MATELARATSTTSSTSVSEPPSLKKKFQCTWPECSKSFSRSEHLHRHALNHKEGDHTCGRCAAHFRRRDLLDRHMLRHKEKDDEAGGEGLGHLATRKRLWRDANGKIVNAPRPHRKNGTRRRQLDSEDRDAGLEEFPEDEIRNAAPPSPPTSIPSTSSGQMSDAQIAHHGAMQEAWPQMEMEMDFIPQHEGGDLDFLSNSSWGSQPFQTFMGAPSDMPYDDIFKPDTAMSFNAPFTTMSYYSWLFENDGSNAESTSLIQPQQPTQAVGFSDSPQTSYSASSLDPNLLGKPPIRQQTQEVPPSYVNNSNQLHQEEPKFNTGYDANCQAAQAKLALHPASVAEPSMDTMLDFSFSPDQGGHSDLALSLESPSFCSGSYQLNSSYPATTAHSSSQISTPPTRRSDSVSSCPLPDALTRRKIPGALPIITNEARDGLMQMISQSRPTKPDGSEINSLDPLLSLLSLQHYSDLFFTRFNSSYPLIHQATFKSSEVHSFLLMSILLLGATYSDKEAHLLAVCVHDIMRPLIHASSSFGTRPDLWMLQTILLVECFGKSRAGEKQHDMSHLYHGLLINLIRRSDCQSACIPAFDAQKDDLEDYWHLAVEAEQKRRLAMLCFMWDTQHAVLFSQSLCMNASELKLTLPWDPSIWEANSAEEWLQNTQASPQPPQYLTILKMYTTPGGPSAPAHLNALSRALILHGLMSVSWDLNRRDQTSLNIAVTTSTLPWQIRIGTCYERWKSDFDSYTASILSSLSFSPADSAKFQRFVVGNLAVYHTAQLILEVDIIDLQIHAGAGHIIGRPVTDFDRQRSRNRIGEWIIRDEGKSAGRAAWHAARLFRDGVRKLENWNVDEMFHYPWCLYLSTLMCWTLHQSAVESRHGAQLRLNEGPLLAESDDGDDEDSDWDSKAEMNALVSGLTRLDPTKDCFVKDMWVVATKYRTAGLVRCMVKQLNTVRWAVVREGMIVLRGLVEGV